MIQVVIDTNVYHDNKTLETPPLLAIRELAQVHLLKLHIPDIVKREFITRVVAEFVEKIDKSIDNINRANGCPLPPEERQELKSTISVLNDLKSHYVQNANSMFDNFATSMNADIDQSYGDADEVFDAYFSGKPPFKQQKYRDDIPDAFIYQVVLSLAKNGDEIYFIGRDERLCGHCSRIPNVTVHNSLESFVSSNVFQTLLKNKETFRGTIEKILLEIPSLLEGKLRKKLDWELMVELNGQQIDSTLADSETSIWNYHYLESLTNRPNSTVYLGEGRFGTWYDLHFFADVVYSYSRYHLDHVKYKEDLDFQQIGETPEGIITGRKLVELDADSFVVVTINYEAIRRLDGNFDQLATLFDHARIDTSSGNIRYIRPTES